MKSILFGTLIGFVLGSLTGLVMGSPGWVYIILLPLSFFSAVIGYMAANDII